MSRFTGELKRLIAKLPQGGADAYKRRLEAFVDLPLIGNEGTWFELLTELQLADDYLFAIDKHLPDVVNEGGWSDKKMPSLWVHMQVVRRMKRDRGILDPWDEYREAPFSQYRIENPDWMADIYALHHNSVDSKLPTPRAKREVRYSQVIGDLRDREAAILTEKEIERLKSLLHQIGTDSGVAEVVIARAIGITRERFFAEASTPAERKQRQAAWKRAKRHKVTENTGALHDKLRDASGKSTWERDVREFLNHDPNPRGTGGGKRIRKAQIPNPDPFEFISSLYSTSYKKDL